MQPEPMRLFPRRVFVHPRYSGSAAALFIEDDSAKAGQIETDEEILPRRLAAIA
jgi:hypothetical protein